VAASSVAGGLPSAISDNVLPQPSRRSLQPLRTSSILPQCSLSSTRSQRSNTETFLLAVTSHRVPSLVKALDRFAAHFRAALTSLSTRMRNTSAKKECLRVFAHRTVLHVPSRSSIRLNIPVRGPRTTTGQVTVALSNGTASAVYVNLLQESLEAVQLTAAVIRRGIRSEVAGSQPSSPATPGRIGYKLRF